MDNSNSYFCQSSNKKDKNPKAHNIWNTSGNDSNPSAIADKLGRSRKKLLDLTLRNRLLNFRPGNPRFSDDGKAHKQIPFQANLSSLWQSLVEDKKSIQVSALTREQLEQVLGSFKNSGSNKELPKSDSKLAISRITSEWADVRESVRGVSQFLEKGNLVSLIPEGSFAKRLAKIRDEQTTLANSTGDSALFLAIGFLEWCETEPHPKANESLFAPLVLVHVALNENKSEKGGERYFTLQMDVDEPQGNPCLAEKLKQDFALDLPDLNLEENETVQKYLARVAKALQSKKNWRVHQTVALGFFNFARYRLWLDLDPGQWPAGKSPAAHAIVGSILNGQPLPQRESMPDDDAVAFHQETEDLPIVLDADSTQYATLLAAKKGVSLVVQGPPGSGKSQTITNLISIAIAEGKSVLFVAQKLPALQVVQRRLEAVELAAFCLPLFSDKARVTEIHKHLAGSAQLREDPDWRRKSRSSVPDLAKQLNAHATLLRSKPAGFTESACTLIQRAVALKMVLSEAWGELWNDGLLSIVVPASEPSSDWLDKRESVINRWHRLKKDNYSAWENWRPIKLASMDAYLVEEVIREQGKSASKLGEHLALLPKELNDLCIDDIEKFASKILESRLFVLEQPIQKLLEFLRKDPKNSAAVAKLERDLMELNKQIQMAQTCLRCADDNNKHIAIRAGEALSDLSQSFNTGYSISQAKSALHRQSQVLSEAEDIVSYARLQPSGITSLGTVQKIDSQQQDLTWEQIRCLSNHRKNPALLTPVAAKLALANYIIDDPQKSAEARTFSQYIQKLNSTLSQFSSHSVDSVRFRTGARAPGLKESVRLLCQNQLETITVDDLKLLENHILLLRVSYEKAKSREPLGFFKAVVGREISLTGDYRDLAILSGLPQEATRIPENGTGSVVSRCRASHKVESRLMALSKLVLDHQKHFQEVSSWFPGIYLGTKVCDNLLVGHERSKDIVHELGIGAYSLASIKELSSKVERFLQSIQTANRSIEPIFNNWPTNPPESLDNLIQLKGLLSHLLNHPNPVGDVKLELLCLQSNVQTVSAAIKESFDLSLFRSNHSDRVAFRDLPSPESIGKHRRELRSLAGVWWRLVSGRYYKVKRELNSFLKTSQASDVEIANFLEELESHELRRIAFEKSNIRLLLGEVFRGIETNWEIFEPTLSWINELKTASGSNDIAGLVQSVCHEPGSLSQGLRSIKTTIDCFEQFKNDLATLKPLSILTQQKECVRLTDLGAALVRVKGLLDELAEQTKFQAIAFPESTFDDYILRFNQLWRLNQSVSLFKEYSDLGEATVFAQLKPEALAEIGDWISALRGWGVPSHIIDALLTKDLLPETHSQFISSVSEVAKHLDELQGFLKIDGACRWTGTEVPLPVLETTLTELEIAANKIRILACESAIDSNTTINQVAELVNSADTIDAVENIIEPWRTILLENPSSVTEQNIAATVDWLNALRQHGANGRFLKWILTEETDTRICWWQELLKRSMGFKNHIDELKDSLSFPFGGVDGQTSLAAWSTEIADRIARNTSGLEVLGSVAQSEDLTLKEFSEAVVVLNRAIQIGEKIEPWTECLGENPTKLEVAHIRQHRTWVSAIEALPASIALWLTSEDTTTRCKLLVQVENLLTDLKQEISKTKEKLSIYGSISRAGPLSIFSGKISLKEIEQRCSELSSNVEQLANYAALLREEKSAREMGIDGFIKHPHAANIQSEILVETFRGAVAWQQAKLILEFDAELRFFDSSQHERLRQEFKKSDDSQLKINRRYIKNKIRGNEVVQGYRGKTASEHTDYALLQHEIGKKRRHLPIRKLIQRAGSAIKSLCPCWMMTPLAVAQFLTPGIVEFDLIIMDEASQINPEDAWGAIARGNQLVVVGDQKQMPPSDFFMSSSDEEDSFDDEDQIDGGKSESILEASIAALFSSSLLWHYRSRQETLIAPANRFSYNNQLILFPHPHQKHPELGIRHYYIENATATSGKVTNILEAGAVANRVRELVLSEFAKKPVDRLTIGVVTMNLHQQDLVVDLLDKMRHDDSQLDLAMSTMSSGQNEEPLFIRNLENIQGDERDVMIISCTYGPHTPGGTPPQRFGPLIREGGERRFNVLITRAKCRMEIFASIRSEHILVEGKRQGVRDFHFFLRYAESGFLAEAGENSFRQSDSPFEIQVAAVLKQAGFETEPQVGVAGYFIDLGVKHPQHAGLFALGIECDGATYHSSRAARDRDRLREKVLMERGWRLYRIWSTDWFVSPVQAKEKLIAAATQACSSLHPCG